MICAIEGKLTSVREGSATVRIDSGLTYELLIPAYALEGLREQHGHIVRFETRHYLESQSQGAVLVPRLIGFHSADERAFFELLTTVKGLGPRKALRALAKPPGEVAGAIARRDHKTLQQLPEIGKRLAETIIVDLADKVARFTLGVDVELETKADAFSGPASDAVAALMALGQNQAEAERAVDRALAHSQAAGRTLATTDAIVTAALAKP